MSKTKQSRMTVLLQYPTWMTDGHLELFVANVTVTCDLLDIPTCAAKAARKQCIKSLQDGSGVDYDEKVFKVVAVISGWPNIITDEDEEL